MEIVERHKLSEKIRQQYQKKFKFGEIDYFLQLLNQKKPHIEVNSSVEDDQNTDRYSSFIQSQFRYEFMMLKCYDHLNKRDISLKIFFLENNEDQIYHQKLEQFAQKLQSLPRRDLLLEILDYYKLNGQNGNCFFFVVEYESVQFSLVNYKELLQEQEVVIKTAINYFEEFLQSKTMIFKEFIVSDDVLKQQVLKHFYITQIENQEWEIKFDSFIPSFSLTESEKLQRFQKVGELFQISTTFQFGVQPQEYQPQALLKDNDIPIQAAKFKRKDLNISRHDLIKFIPTCNSDIIKHHQIELFEIISKQSEYDLYQFLEFDQNTIFLAATKQEDQTQIQLRFEKFKDHNQAAEAEKKFKDIMKCVKDLFLPIYKITLLDLNKSSYIIIEEKRVTKQIRQLNDSSPIFTCSLHAYTLSLSETFVNKRKKNLEITVQSIEKIEKLHENNLYHGQLSSHNILLEVFEETGNSQIIVYLSNKIIDIIREEDKFTSESIIKGKQKDHLSMKLVMQELAQDIKNTASFGFQDIQSYNQLLQFQYSLYTYYDEASKTTSEAFISLKQNKRIKRGINLMKNLIHVQKLQLDLKLKRVDVVNGFVQVKFDERSSYGFGYQQQQVEDHSNYINIFLPEVKRVELIINTKKYFTEQFLPLLTQQDHVKELIINVDSISFNFDAQQTDNGFSLKFLNKFPNLKKLQYRINCHFADSSELLEIINLKKLKALQLSLNCKDQKDEDYLHNQEYSVYKVIEMIFQEKKEFLEIDLQINSQEYFLGMSKTLFAKLKEKRVHFHQQQQQSSFKFGVKQQDYLPFQFGSIQQENEAKKNFTISQINSQFQFGTTPTQKNDNKLDDEIDLKNEASSLKFEIGINEIQQPVEMENSSTINQDINSKENQFSLSSQNEASTQNGFRNFGYLDNGPISSSLFGEKKSDFPTFPPLKLVDKQTMQQEDNKDQTQFGFQITNNQNDLQNPFFMNPLSGFDANNNWKESMNKFEYYSIRKEHKECIISFLEENKLKINTKDLTFFGQLDFLLLEYTSLDMEISLINSRKELQIILKVKNQPQISDLTYTLSLSEEGNLLKKIDYKDIKQFQCHNLTRNYFDGNTYGLEQVVINWISNSFEAYLLNRLGSTITPICSHCDLINRYLSWLSHQINLQKLKLYLFDVCQTVIHKMKEDKAFLSFTQPQFRKVYELSLEFAKIPPNLKFFRQLYINLKQNSQLKCLNISYEQTHEQILFQENQIFRNNNGKDFQILYKIPRLVTLKFEEKRGQFQFGGY